MRRVPESLMMDRYDEYSYEKFRELAVDPGKSIYEKIGFPDSYRKNSEEAIFADIVAKTPRISEADRLNVLDIGPGCSRLPHYISRFCREHEHRLWLADSNEMLALIEDAPHQSKIPGLFPLTAGRIKKESGGVDVVICYSVLHYIFFDSNIWFFLDCLLGLLNDGGQAILGDIPNISKRKRFFASRNGAFFHQQFTETNELPQVEFSTPEPGKIDDALLLSIVLRCQASGFDAYVVPQPVTLPFANRRDDILIRKP